MVPLGPDGPTPLQHAIDGLGRPDRETLHAARKPRRRIRFHEQVEMVGLHAELKNPEHVPGCVAERALERGKDVAPAQRSETGRRPQRDMNGMAWLVWCAATVRHRPAAGRTLASGVGTAAAPGADDELELFGCVRHLNWAMIIPI
jgi:hypothetical protein